MNTNIQHNLSPDALIGDSRKLEGGKQRDGGKGGERDWRQRGKKVAGYEGEGVVKTGQDKVATYCVHYH